MKATRGTGVAERGVVASRCSRRSGTSRSRTPISSPGGPATRATSPAPAGSPPSTPGPGSGTATGGCSSPRWTRHWSSCGRGRTSIPRRSTRPRSPFPVTRAGAGTSPSPSRSAGPDQLPATGAVVGVDLGIKDFAVTSGGVKIPNPRKLARRERNLARYQRQARPLPERLREPGQGQGQGRPRAPEGPRVPHRLPAPHLYPPGPRPSDVIVAEDLAVKNMVRNRSLAKAISDCGWGTFRQYAGVQDGQGRAAPDRDRTLVPQLQDLLSVRASARRTPA